LVRTHLRDHGVLLVHLREEELDEVLHVGRATASAGTGTGVLDLGLGLATLQYLVRLEPLLQSF
jgi:EAL domain-containing protein (putative c-di-GMP-specific phosphodiesterase class I)